MSGFLLDTNVISEYSRSNVPHEGVRTWLDRQPESSLHLSVLTLGEIRKGATLLPESSKRKQLELWLATELPMRFANRLLPINQVIAELWGAMAAQAQLKGVTLAVIDGLIAATAIHYNLEIVTRNVKDFAVWGVSVVNPWDG
jgi:Predicted nucleic acid-binding protein, contains PIN domain